MFMKIILRKSSVHCTYFTFTRRKISNYPARILSGIQPTGTLHIGNYFGAIEKWVQFQNENEDVICSIADLHAITLRYDEKSLPRDILLMAATLIGCGIDPSKSILFLQSEIAQHTQLSWILGCLTTMARLNHLPQYKEKSESIKDIPLGIYVYPVLQAADILLYRATHVPVGEDQVQHVQLARNLAEKFNVLYGETFPVPRPVIHAHLGSRIRNLRSPNRKMSKSNADTKSRIEILDSPDVIVEKIKKAVTDCTSTVTYEPDTRLGVSNLIAIHSLCTGLTPEQICNEASTQNTGEFKMIVADALIAKLLPIQNRIDALLKSDNEIKDILTYGANRARTIAESTWTDVVSKIGINYHVATNIELLQNNSEASS